MEPVDGRRVALIIGNSAYQNVSNWGLLDNAVHDARYIESVLSDPARGAARFETTLITDATLEETLAAVHSFAAQAENADIALVYYAGHGFQYNGENYLAPVDAPGGVGADTIAQHYVTMTEIIGAASAAEGLTIFLLDACRTEGPIVSRSNGQQSTAPPFGAIDAPEAVILYATANGDAAYDAAPPGQPLSPFATAIGRAINEPGLDIPYVFNTVHQSVREATQIYAPEQRPVFMGSYSHRFFFVPPEMPDFSPSVQIAALRLPRAPIESSAIAPGGVVENLVARGPEGALELSSRELETIDENNLVGRVLTRNSMRTLRQTAEAGNPVAMSILGYILAYGASGGDMGTETVGPDRAEAQQWLERAAATGHPAGQLELANLLLLTNQADEFDRAVSLVTQAAAQDYPKALSYLFHLVRSGRIEGRDWHDELGLLRRAARLGHAWSHYALVLEDDRPARHIAELEELSREDNPEGDHWLCRIAELPYIAERGHVVANAFDHCLAAANANYAYSQALTAKRYTEGRGVDADPAQALLWARIASTRALDDDALESWIERFLDRS